MTSPCNHDAERTLPTWVIDHMKLCGFTTSEDGSIIYNNALDIAYMSWEDALTDCIEVVCDCY